MPDILPSWFELPIAEVVADCRLRVDQFQGADGAAVMATEIERRIPEMGEFVLGKLRTTALRGGLIGSLADDLNEILTFGQKTTVRAATRLLVIAAMYGVFPGDKGEKTSKNLVDGDTETGRARLGSAQSLIQSLEDQLETLSEVRAGASNASESIAVNRAREKASTEYFRELPDLRLSDYARSNYFRP